MAASSAKNALVDKMKATIYGNCIGDAIGLLTEFMSKEEAKQCYGNNEVDLEYKHKVTHRRHQRAWENGDWTDDSDQMILIMKSLLDNKGQIVPVDFGKKLKHWVNHGFPELGDHGGMGLGATTHHVISSPVYDTDPHEAAKDIWERSGQLAAPNGGVMRTSVLGLYEYTNMKAVIENTLQICKVTHADPRCQASCVAVTTAIAQMLQGKHKKEGHNYDNRSIDKVIKESFEYAMECYPKDWKHFEIETREHMFAKNIADLKLDERPKIGYTLKCMGAGFWALRQDDFQKAMTAIVFEAGDADTNGAVAGALLGCKLGMKGLPQKWLDGLAEKPKRWLDPQVDDFITLATEHTGSEERPESDQKKGPDVQGKVSSV